MFTGIIEATGRLKNLVHKDSGSAALQISCSKPLDLKLGDSLAVNGCCLSLTRSEEQDMYFDVSQETLAKTNIGKLALGSLLNLERPLRLSDFLGGHLVTGHVDGLAHIKNISGDENIWLMTIALQDYNLAKYCVHKGSICVNGVSLTINDIHEARGQCDIDLTLIPETLQRTNLAELEVGSHVNIEVDILAKHIEKISKFKPLATI